MDQWIFDSTQRIKVFFCYFLIFATFFIFSDIMVYFYTKSLYQPITGYEVNCINPEITVLTAEASNSTGNLGGIIKNTTNEKMEEQYIKFEFYTPRDVKMGTKYLKVDSLEPNGQQEYEFGFRYDNIEHVKISRATEEEINTARTTQFELDSTYGPSGFILGVISHKNK